MRYRGYDVFGMPTPSSGGSTVGEGLNIVENWDLGDLSQTQALHRYLEASALAFADRNRYVGDNYRALLDELLNPGFAREQACLDRPRPGATQAGPPGVPDGSYDRCAIAAAGVGADRRAGDHQPHGRRPVGQRRGVHADDRADRR